jgi:hypothetical protein
MQNKFFETPLASLEHIAAESEDIEGEKMQETLGTLRKLLSDMKKVKPLWWPDDTTVHEVISIAQTDMDPTDPRHIDEFAGELSSVDWNTPYKPPFHEEMVANYEEYLKNREEDGPEL